MIGDHGLFGDHSLFGDHEGSTGLHSFKGHVSHTHTHLLVFMYFCPQVWPGRSSMAGC